MTDADQPEHVVDVYADVSCPFAHFSLRRFTARRHQAGAEHVRLRVHAWPLELANGEPLEVGRVTDEIADLRAQVAGDLFTGFDPAAFPSSTIAILGTATLTYQRGADLGEAFNLAIREALFEQGKAIGDPDVLAEIAARFDLEVPDAASARAAVDADFVEGQRRVSPAPPTSSSAAPHSSVPPSTSNAKASTSASTSTKPSSTGSSTEHSSDTGTATFGQRGDDDAMTDNPVRRARRRSGSSRSRCGAIRLPGQRAAGPLTWHVGDRSYVT